MMRGCSWIMWLWIATTWIFAPMSARSTPCTSDSSIAKSPSTTALSGVPANAAQVFTPIAAPHGSVAAPLERRPGRESLEGVHLDPVDRDGQRRAWHRHLDHARLHLGLEPRDPPDQPRIGSGRECRPRGEERQQHLPRAHV